MSKRELDKAWDEVRLKFADAVANAMYKTITSKPNHELTPIGYKLASAIALKHYWNEVSVPDAIKMMMDYIEVEPGAEGYTWTYSAAQDVAREYVSEFGEH